MNTLSISRRSFHRRALAVAAVSCLPARAGVAAPFAFRHVIASSLFGKLPLDVILPEIGKCASSAIDLWPEPHGNQRGQVDDMGLDRFAALLERHRVKVEVVTRYDLGPFGLEPELPFARRFGVATIVTGARGPKGLAGAELKRAVSTFVEQLKPHVARVEEAGITVAIENHGNGLVDSPDSMKWLVELCPSPRLGIALAPYHLPQDPALVAALIRALGDRIAVFYAWQHGEGSGKGLTKPQELLQMPGRGPLDFRPLVDALKEIRYAGATEIFMHPYPRGIPILPSAPEITAEFNRARAHLESLL